MKQERVCIPFSEHGFPRFETLPADAFASSKQPEGVSARPRIDPLRKRSISLSRVSTLPAKVIENKIYSVSQRIYGTHILASGRCQLGDTLKT